MRAILPLFFCLCPALARSALADPSTAREPRPQQTATPPQGASRAPVFVDAQVLLWEPGVKNAYPRWSADGRRILYQSNRSGTWHVHVMDADGTDDRALDGWPTWTPDGRRIVFSSARTGSFRLYVMDASGGAASQLTLAGPEYADARAAVSADGTKIVFNRDSRDTIGVCVIDLPPASAARPG